MERGGGGGPILSNALIDIRSVAETGSTNADLLEFARAGAAEGLWLRAERQTGGRGRQGREWASPPGNLYASTLVRLRPGDPPAHTLALAAGVALHDAVSLGLLKWPNDLLIEGAKVSGILLERTEDAVVIGFGVNLAHAPALLDRPTTCLAHNGIVTTPDAFLRRLAASLAARLAEWRGTFATIRATWLAAAHPQGTPLAVKLPDGTVATGTFAGIDDEGALRLRLAGGAVRVIHAGDVLKV